MTTQATTPAERKKHGEHCVKVVFGHPVGPATGELERLRNFIPPDVSIETSDDGYGSAVYLVCSSKAVKRYTENSIDGPRRIENRIDRYRKWVAVHSYIYYEEGTTVVPDPVWDAKARRLARMQNVHPTLGTWHNDAFSDFDGSTGMNLPRTEEVKSRAEELIDGD